MWPRGHAAAALVAVAVAGPIGPAVVTFAVGAMAVPAAATASPPADSSAASAMRAAPRDPDLLLGALAAGAFTLAATHDLEITRRVADAPPSTTADDAARAFRQLGNPVVLGTALAATWGAARLAHAPGLGRATIRIGVSIVVPSVACLALKETIGRMRPKDSPDDAWRFDSFSGDGSLPSGHTTMAFAAAAALDRETTARWVPWVAYPAAAACGWSRVHDLEHWTSDVVAGAALGYWGGRATDDFLRRRDAAAGRLSFAIVPLRDGARVTVVRRF